jgi:aminodeoxyfutalosine deaminase
LPDTTARADLASLIPKAEIHLHLEGSIELETLLLLRGARGESRGPEARAALQPLYIHRDFPDFLRHFATVCAELRRPEDFARITAALSARLRSERVRYAEVFCSPQIFEPAGPPAREIAEAMSRAAQAGEVEGGPRLRFLFDGVRQFGIGRLERLVEQAVECRMFGVIGVGVGGDERALPTASFEPVFREARRLGLRTTIHAGEFDGPRSVWEAVEVLEAERIGHGIRATEDAVLLEMLRSHAVPIECCPTSNRATGVVGSWEEHPIRGLVAAGCRVTVNSDDPALFGTTLAGEWRVLETRLGFSPEEVLAIARSTARATFLAEGEREALVAEIDRAAADAGYQA